MIEQIAIRVRDIDQAMVEYKNVGVDEWVQDVVVARGKVWSPEFGYRATCCTARLAYNYQLIPGKEFELLQYIDGLNFHQLLPGTFGLSHMGLHVPDIDSARMAWPGAKVVQEVETYSHTNPAVPADRRYRYVILDTRTTLGYFTKLIQRVTI